MENNENKTEMGKSNENHSPKQKSVFTTTSQIYQQPKPSFNPNAKPFNPSRLLINIGPSKLAVNAKVWDSIASTRALPPIYPTAPEYYESETFPTKTMNVSVGSNLMPSSVNLCLPQDAFDLPGFANNNPPAFDSDPHRRLYLRREFGPVASKGFIEVRLHRGISVWVSLDRAVLIENGEVRIAVSADTKLCALEHPNGRVRQVPERIDIVAFDGFKKNNFVRYAKMWKDSISLTAHGCCLTYLVDPAGTRTTSDQVNREWEKDYCKEAFFENFIMRTQGEIDFAATNYNYKVDEDGTESFNICGVRVSQASDGMVRVSCNERYSIRASVENRSVTLTTPNIYCTASMSDSPHLFVRRFERRIHFDGSNFVVRNLGHSASFDTLNRLRIH